MNPYRIVGALLAIALIAYVGFALGMVDFFLGNELNELNAAPQVGGTATVAQAEKSTTPAVAAPITQKPGELATAQADTLGSGLTGRRDGLLFPLPYVATVTQGNGRTKFYVPRQIHQ